jgi:hypothetical protein
MPIWLTREWEAETVAKWIVIGECRLVSALIRAAFLSAIMRTERRNGCLDGGL